MAWESRWKKRFYYRSRRRGSQVIKEYVGTGPAAEQAAEEDALRRAQRAADRQARRQERVALEILDQAFVGLGERCKELMSAALIGAGYHQHHGEWRKKDMSARKRLKHKANEACVEKQRALKTGEHVTSPSAPVEKTATAGTPDVLSIPGPMETVPITREEYDALVAAANRDDAGAQAQLRKLLDECPYLWQKSGDLASYAEMSLIGAISKGEWLATEALRRKAADLRQQLAGDAPTPLDTLLVAWVVACSLHMQYLDSQLQQAEGDLQHAAFWLKRQDQAHRRFYAAVKCLTTTRERLGAAAGAGRSEVTACPLREKSEASAGRACPLRAGDSPSPEFAAAIPEPEHRQADDLQERSKSNGHCRRNRLEAALCGRRKSRWMSLPGPGSAAHDDDGTPFCNTHGSLTKARSFEDGNAD